MANPVFPYTIKIPARDKSEGRMKIQALANLAGSLDGKTLQAIGKKLPEILADPNLKDAISGYLDL
ncbi:MAG: hypothetical protein H6581_20640 [Bacteroidia bacterium]|nr:hypothetical protein [Bacteroidia bacterium]